MGFYCGNIEKILSGLCLDKDSGFDKPLECSKLAAGLPSLMWNSDDTKLRLKGIILMGKGAEELT